MTGIARDNYALLTRTFFHERPGYSKKHLNAIGPDPNEEDGLLTYEISDEVLENAGNEKAGNITQWLCTAVHLCPGP